MTPAVALFNTDFLPYSQTFVYEEIRHHERYAVEVFCKRRLLADRFPFEPVHVGGPRYGLTCRSAAFDARFRMAGFALVHAHFGPGAVYARPFARRHRLPLVVTFHGYDVPLLSSPRRWLPRHLRYAMMGPRVLRDMTLGLCVSAALREQLVAAGAPADRVTIHRLGVDLASFRPGLRDVAAPRVIMVGRFIEKKGFAGGLRAFAMARATAPAATLTLIGDGPLGPALRALAGTLGLGSAVTFTGVLPAAGVARQLADADILLVPSVTDAHGNREGLPTVLLEGMASGCAVVGTIHSGIPEAITDGESGFLVAEGDEEALADRLARLLGDAELRRRLGAGGRARIERDFDVRARGRALEDHYDEARARHAAGR